MPEQIYREINTVDDITKINEEIREQIKNADSRDTVTELKRRSRYLVVLLAPDNPAGPAEMFRSEGNLEDAQKRAWNEYVTTTKVANENRHGGSEYTVGEKPDYVKGTSAEYKETTEKYEGETKTYWITYEVPSKSTEEPVDKAKRFYVSGKLKDTEGPDTFENKLGNKTYGIKVTYDNPRKGYDAERDGTKYHVEPTMTTITKIVELPEDAINVEITEEEPKSAMSVR